MSYRIKPQDLDRTSNSAFMTPHAARCTIPLEDALASEELFLTVRSNLRAGDQVTLCRYSSGDWMKARILEYATVIITESTPKAVEFFVKEPIVVIADAKPELQVAPAEPELPELEVISDPQGGFLVRDVATGHVHKHFKIKAPAVKYINDYGRKAVAEAA
jgi:hypothetical protein